jgi:ferredoxin
VRFEKLGRSAEAKTDETLLDVARRAGAPLGNSCGGTGICARCTVTVLAGGEALSPPTSVESRVAAQRGLSADERLACQAVVRGDCTVTTSYW